MKYLIFLAVIGVIGVIGVIAFVILLKNKNKDMFIYKDVNSSEELVIAVCNEDVSWVDNYANKYNLITVYNKCKKVLNFKSSNIKVIESPNIGTCDNAYLSYIIDRYDNLPDFVEFTKGWVHPKRMYYKCLKCDKVKHSKEFNELMDFSLPYWNFSNKVNSHKEHESKYYKSGYKNMGEWIKNSDFLNEDLYKKNICNIILGGNFSTTNENIRKTPKKDWEKLRSLQKYTREEVDHFIERTWGALLCR